MWSRPTPSDHSPRRREQCQSCSGTNGPAIEGAATRKAEGEPRPHLPNRHPLTDPANLPHQPRLLSPTHVVSGSREILRVDVGEVLQVQRLIGLPDWGERTQATSPRGLMACLVFDCGRDSRLPAHESPAGTARQGFGIFTGFAAKLSFGGDAKCRPARRSARSPAARAWRVRGRCPIGIRPHLPL